MSKPRRAVTDVQEKARGLAWFRALFGVNERAYPIVQKDFMYDAQNHTLTAPNGRVFTVGAFSTPSVRELRQSVQKIDQDAVPAGSMEVIHTAVSDVLLMHAHPNFHLATFQVASQFNCLEFPSYDVIPEEGIKYYIDDPTQGPACSLAAAPGTLFRNYFVQVDPASPNVGQRQRRQINNLAGVERLLHTSDPKTWFWRVSNGYTIMKRKRLPKLAQMLEEEPKQREQIVEHLRVGVQLGTQVVFRSRNGDTFHLLPRTSKQLVNQVFCSAMSLHPDVVHDASCIAPLVLRACYEATIAQAILAAQWNNWEHGAANVVLTFVGGGAFGNDIEWIVDAIARACATFAAFPLKVYVAHYRAIDFGIEAMINSRIDAYLQQNASHGEHKCVHITRGDWQDGPVARTSSAPEATSTAFATDVAPMVTAARAVDDLAISTTSSGSTGRSGGRTVLKVADSHVMDDDDDDDHDDDHDDDDDGDHVGDVGDDDGTAFIYTDGKASNPVRHVGDGADGGRAGDDDVGDDAEDRDTSSSSSSHGTHSPKKKKKEKKNHKTRSNQKKKTAPGLHRHHTKT